MKLISWNVNGIRACVGKGFYDSVRALNPDMLCLQETKIQPGQFEAEMDGYFALYSYAEKKGYSGTALFTRAEPKSVTYGMGISRHDTEGRLITADYGDYYLVVCYTPNAQRGLTRLDYRMEWEEDFRRYLMALDEKKPVIMCGDLNVAHQEIDLKNPKSNHMNAGFTDQERAAMTRLLESGFVDSFRYFYPNAAGAYSWWSYMGRARENNVGWRIDYFIVSSRFAPRMIDASIHPEIMGSDHCPVELDIADS